MSNKSVYLIGAGRMGRSHAQAALELGYSLQGVCDPRLEARDRLGEEFNVPPQYRFAEASEMLETLDAADLVIVATTADTHCDLVCRAANAFAKAVLCEKPMAVSLEQCDQMIKTCQEKGTRLAVNHQMRFMPQYKIVKSILNDGRLGELTSMNVVGGCFGLAMNGSHYIEAFNFLADVWPSRVSAIFTGVAFQNPRGPQYFDQAGDFYFTSEQGQRLSMSIGHDQGHGMTVMYAGNYGHIFVDELQGEVIVTSRLKEHRNQPLTRYGMPWARETISFPQSDNVEPTRKVIAALMAGEGFPSGQNGRNVVASLVAAYHSASTNGQFVDAVLDTEMTRKNFPWA
ncbi:Gfo/Idh/MocA family protein [Thalassospira australica]|uniref:Gfo/Idh/MocA family protein n=1 Tax=Thalassospira australica TaxID=1528106 RepID=UPI000AAD6474|nr:Gfo/Idh/MocA family oxidoreductase [Thalassospira australica]